MKALIGGITFGIVLALTSGCENGWSFGGSSQSWNSSQGWVDFSGRYQPSIAGRFLVSDYTSLRPGTNSVVETVATTVAGQTLYSGTLNQIPVLAGSLYLTVGSIALGHDAGGNITGTGIASGSIDYNGGNWSVTLSAAPPAGIDMVANFRTVNTSSAGGTGVNITAFEVTQQGNTLRIMDNNGSVYEGNLGAYTTLGSTPVGDTTNGIHGAGGQTATVQYELNGVSAAGMNVQLVGNLLAQVSQSVSIIGGFTTNIVVIQQTWNRYIRGTWLEQGGKTGNIDGQADPIVTQQTGSGGTP